MRTYETTILIPLGQIRADREGTLAAVKGLYEAEGVKFLDFTEWQERKLAYPIKGETSALYVTAYFEAPNDAITRIEHKSHLCPQILRHLIIERAGKALERIRDQRAKAIERKAAEEAARAAAAESALATGISPQEM